MRVGHGVSAVVVFCRVPPVGGGSTTGASLNWANATFNCVQGRSKTPYRSVVRNWVLTYVLMSLAAACSRSPPNFIAVDPANRSNTWALERADIDCKAQVIGEGWGSRWRLRYRADPKYASCMQQKGFVQPLTDAGVGSID
jgi:hypothetical protein